MTDVRGFNDNASTFGTLTSANLAMSGILAWSPKGSDFSFPTGDLAGWRSYVTQQLRRYPEVTHWEVWNEPPNFTKDTSPKSYATIVEAAYDTAKKVNPKVQIGIATKSTFLRWLGEAIKDGAAGHYDYITLHPYERAALLTDGADDAFMAIVPQVRSMLAEVDPTKQDVPVRFTEVGAAVSAAGHQLEGTVTDQQQADILVKSYALGLAQGVEQIAWFDPFDGDADGTTSPAFGLITRSGQTRPAFTALTSLIAALGPLPTSAGWVHQSDGAVVLAFTQSGRVTLAAWADPRTTPTLTFSRAATVVDPDSGESSTATSVKLTQDPVLITVSGADATTWLDTSKPNSQRLFSRADTGTKTAWLDGDGRSQNLTWLGAPASTTADGKSVLAASAGTSVPLFVNPAYSAWKGVDLVLKVRAYGLKSGAGFNVRYDADKPVAQLDAAGQASVSGGWREVPQGTWTTLTIKLPRASFTGTYGPNISLNSDSTDHSGYAISRITLATE